MLYGCQVAVQLRPVLQLQTQRVASPFNVYGRESRQSISGYLDVFVGRMLVPPTTRRK